MKKQNTPSPIFYDPTGRRWRVFLLSIAIISIVSAILLIPVFKNNLTIHAAKSILNSKNIRKKTASNNKTFITYSYSAQEFSRFRENYQNIHTIYLDYLNPKIFDNKVSLNPKSQESTENFDKFLSDNNLSPNLFVNLKKPQSQSNYLNLIINKPNLHSSFAGELKDLLIEKKMQGVNVDLTNIDLMLLNKKNFQEFTSTLKSTLGSSRRLTVTLPYWEGGRFMPQYVDDFDGVVINISQQNPYQKLDYLNQFSKYILKQFSKYDPQKLSILVDPRSYLVTKNNQGISDFEHVGFGSIGYAISEGWQLKAHPNNNNLFPYLENQEQGEEKYHIFDSAFFYNLQYKILNESNITTELGLSNIGSEDPMIWKIINNNNYQSNQRVLQDFLFDTEVISLDQGDLVISSSKLIPGQRSLTIQNNYITDWRINSMPQNPRLLSTRASKDSVALTFDDSPHPIYTPQILDILNEKGVKGVFFVTGQSVENNPGIANRIVQEGHLIANHTYDHPRTYTMSDSEFKAQIESTQEIIKNITGVTPKYFRIPFSDSSSIENIEDLRRYKILEEYGLQTAHYDVDSKDWELNDAPKIVDLVLTHDLKNSSQLLFHDGGSNRSSTVEALPAIIDNIHDQGLKIVTIDQFTAAPAPTAKQSQKSFSQLGFSVQSIGSNLVWYYLILFSLLTSIRYFGLWFLNILNIFLPKNNSKNYTPFVSILIPCYNEENTIVRTVEAALASHYPKFEVIVVDDGSTDSSFQNLLSNFAHNPKVNIISIDNSGKAKALNKALNFAKGSLILSIDADTLVYPDTLKNLVRSMDKRTGAVAGNIQVGNDNNILTKNQRLEYINGQNFDKVAYGLINGIVVVPGALGLWRKKAILQVGGYQKDTLAEDADLTIRLYQNNWKVKYNSKAIAITESPDTVSKLVKQRVRWMYGILQVVFKNRNMILNPKFGFLGMVVLPEVLFNILFLPVTLVTNFLFILLFIKAFGRILGYSLDSIPYLNSVESSRIYQLIVFFIVTYTISLLLAIYRDRSEAKWSLIWQVPFSLFVYRNALWLLNILVIFKVFKGKRQGWNHFHKVGQVKLMGENKQASKLLTQP